MIGLLESLKFILISHTGKILQWASFFTTHSHLPSLCMNRLLPLIPLEKKLLFMEVGVVIITYNLTLIILELFVSVTALC